MSEQDDEFHRAAHPVGRLARVFVWVAMALAFALQHRIGIGAGIIICILLFAAFIAFRDKTPKATANDGVFWRIALGEQIWKAGGAPPETAKSVDLFGKFGIGLAVLGIALCAWLGPVGFGATLAYLVVTAVRYRMLAALGDAVA